MRPTTGDRPLNQSLLLTHSAGRAPTCSVARSASDWTAPPPARRDLPVRSPSPLWPNGSITTGLVAVRAGGALTELCTSATN